MPGLGRKTWSPGDTLNAADVNGYLMDQSVMVFAGTAARASAIPTPSAGMVAYSTATSLQVYDGSAWVDLSTGYGVASGATGTATVGGTAYAYTSFTSNGTLTVTKAGLFDVLAFGGGSGGGTYTGNTGSSGGGSGGILLETIYLDANTAVVIGAGGAAGTYAQFTRYGSASTIGSLPSGRVAAGSFSTCNLGTGASEGFLGGLVGSILVTSTGATNVQGYAGGNSTASTNGGGGGGTSAVGGNGSGTTGGNGGAGYDVSTFIGGSALFKGAGGGGSGSVTQGTGGSSIGGNASATNGVAAAANTASGGGAGNTASGAGGSGIVYIRWKV